MSDSGSLIYDNLIAGTQKDLVTRPATIRIFEAFSRGALLGRLAATGKWQVIDEGGVATCDDFGIATEAVDTSAGAEAVTDVFVEGEFSENAVGFSYGDTADDWRELLTPHGIYLRKTINTAGV
jgi:hypothetical protein